MTNQVDDSILKLMNDGISTTDSDSKNKKTKALLNELKVLKDRNARPRTINKVILKLRKLGHTEQFVEAGTIHDRRIMTAAAKEIAENQGLIFDEAMINDPEFRKIVNMLKPE